MNVVASHSLGTAGRLDFHAAAEMHIVLAVPVIALAKHPDRERRRLSSANALYGLSDERQRVMDSLLRSRSLLARDWLPPAAPLVATVGERDHCQRVCADVGIGQKPVTPIAFRACARRVGFSPNADLPRRDRANLRHFRHDGLRVSSLPIPWLSHSVQPSALGGPSFHGPQRSRLDGLPLTAVGVTAMTKRDQRQCITGALCVSQQRKVTVGVRFPRRLLPHGDPP
jgi:hypothetical protein